VLHASVLKKERKNQHVQCSLAHIEAFGKPHRLGPVAASSNENKYNYSSSQFAFFKVVWEMLEFQKC
jgi:hypothetical protein